MRVREVAERLEVSEATIYALVAAGKLKCSRVGLGRGVIRISEEHVKAYLERSEPKASVPSAPSPRVKLRHLTE